MKPTPLLAIGSLVLAFVSVACSSTVETAEIGSSSGTGGKDGGTGGGPPPECPVELPPCCEDAPDDPCCEICFTPPKPCGGELGATCAPEEYCDFPDQMCGGNDGTGLCVRRPDGCIDIDNPVCGCDGKVYESTCDAAYMGTDVSTLGGCAPPPGKFGCGLSFCEIGVAYCAVIIQQVMPGQPTAYSCTLLPDACNGVTDCDCLADEPCGNTCTATADGGAQVTCGGG
ncbi:Kazal-type serine protease inhibitor domain protein [Minicystis rosea]|nr:Kazal-type serine protease inhibitor domain protein [Minicystis rosea]